MSFCVLKCYMRLKKPSAPVAQWIEQPPSKVFRYYYATEVIHKYIHAPYAVSGVVLTPLTK